ncbi:Na/Pi cotransporter family protein [Bacillus sp. HMF5848]|uniref:Na/Pi cotransporter family protein n=1 Tax=Bacillus sp. HMF5848 TaxID=2495421 RepID=UPI000F784F7E|nr:Na/Pi cotransporter family protein [Bacillus sp. HMF5848]RSK27127.1 Na/Pi cotransporter family protein [Bacillus sp. HMF5848]
MDLHVQEMIFQFFGGLGIFLFGIKYMGDGLQQSAGDRLREILDRFTTNPLMGVLAGIIVTVLIQSSSGTTALTVGLVSAGFMTLRQAIGVIMGANIGTTVTAFIIGIKISEYALPIIAVGAFLIFFFKHNKVQSLGKVIFGFGSLFLGLSLMSSGMKPLRSLDAFYDLTLSMSDNPFLGVVIGTVFTVIVQSSSATIGILQELFGQDLLTLQAALPVLFGDNIGTTITAVLASIGTAVAARRAALAHVVFNITGTVVFLILLVPFTKFIAFLQTSLGLNPEMTIAFAHGTFNVTNTILLFPFVGFIAWIVTKAIPGEDLVVDGKPQNLNYLIIDQAPSLALGQAKKEVIRMGSLSKQGLEEVRQFMANNQKKHADIAYEIEEAINNLDRKITDYLVAISGKSLSHVDSEVHSFLMDAVRDIERIGDHMENIVELIEYKVSRRLHISDEALEELNTMMQLTADTLENALKSLDKNDLKLAEEVLNQEKQIDSMERMLRRSHIRRLNEGGCTGHAGIIFVDIVSNLERIGDHAVNIADMVIDMNKVHDIKKA